MNKSELIRIANTYGMELTRNPITSEAWCYRLESNDYIDELDKIADAAPEEILPCAATREDFGDWKVYTIIFPTDWATLAGMR